ncbi:ferric reduction oxidase 7, chloroplastic-like [Olea europaea subsp. europaea]|uniref:Ferric reduction oxidase 7, chloroplastic-like n=1 Tax=Olea europaea subsp. europaea TaxID=158383 RepID=A0A8S0UDW8_OLEEU|nr:ferric reduction oxidase 7, chloroplastic-like [Olea europaea subsp. europaea]
MGGMSVLVGTGNIIWSGLYVIMSTLGLITTVYLLNILYINPHNIHSWWHKGLLFIACMTTSVVLFVGLAIGGLWHMWERKLHTRRNVRTSQRLAALNIRKRMINKNSGQEQYLNIIRYGQRPEFSGTYPNLSLFLGLLSLSSFLDDEGTLPAQSCPTNSCFKTVLET